MKFKYGAAALPAIIVALLASSAQAGTLTVNNMSSNTADSMAQAVVGSIPGVTLVPNSAHYTGASIASGTFTGGSGILSLSSGIVLTTGSVNNVPGPNSTTGATYPNNTAGDADLNNLVNPP